MMGSLNSKSKDGSVYDNVRYQFGRLGFGNTPGWRREGTWSLGDLSFGYTTYR
jgi:hypothetical protein